MKITASFNSPDSADFAAGALKRALSPLTRIETKNVNSMNLPDSMNIFAAFNSSAPTPTYSLPIYTPAFFESAKNRERDLIGTDCILEVTCRKEEEAAASRIIIGHGGRNISKLS